MAAQGRRYHRIINGIELVGVKGGPSEWLNRLEKSENRNVVVRRWSTPNERCDICFEDYEDPHHYRVACSSQSQGGCRTFSMCRICVFGQAMHGERLLVIDEEANYAVELDATTCPQCKQRGAFQENQLKPLPPNVEERVRDRAQQEREAEEERAVDHVFQNWISILETTPTQRNLMRNALDDSVTLLEEI